MVTACSQEGKVHVFQVIATNLMEDTQIYPEGTVKISYRSAFDGKTDWALFTPGNLSKNTIVYMHGSFSHADQIYTREDIRTFWLTRILKGEHPLLSINMRDTSYMSPAATKDLTDLLDYCSEHLNCKNYVLLGGSGGASSAMVYALVQPEKLYAVIAMGMQQFRMNVLANPRCLLVINLGRLRHAALSSLNCYDFFRVKGLMISL